MWILVFSTLNMLILTKDGIDHFFYVLSHLNKILVRYALSLIHLTEIIELRDWIMNIIIFFLFDGFHVKICFAVELRGFELMAFLNIHRAATAGLGDYKITCGLTADPSCRHITDF